MFGNPLARKAGPGAMPHGVTDDDLPHARGMCARDVVRFDGRGARWRRMPRHARVLRRWSIPQGAEPMPNHAHGQRFRRASRRGGRGSELSYRSCSDSSQRPSGPMAVDVRAPSAASARDPGRVRGGSVAKRHRSRASSWAEWGRGVRGDAGRRKKRASIADTQRSEPLFGGDTSTIRRARHWAGRSSCRCAADPGNRENPTLPLFYSYRDSV